MNRENGNEIVDGDIFRVAKKNSHARRSGNARELPSSDSTIKLQHIEHVDAERQRAESCNTPFLRLVLALLFMSFSASSLSLRPL